VGGFFYLPLLGHFKVAISKPDAHTSLSKAASDPEEAPGNCYITPSLLKGTFKIIPLLREVSKASYNVLFWRTI
jgi:hypothetical protein